MSLNLLSSSSNGITNGVTLSSATMTIAPPSIPTLASSSTSQSINLNGNTALMSNGGNNNNNNNIPMSNSNTNNLITSSTNIVNAVSNHHLSTNSNHQSAATTTTSTKLNLQQQITNGLFIRKEIQRFESVHPNIYSVYDLIDNIPDFNLQQQIREHIVNIEDSFVNSQEWTLSRSVPDIKLGILGSVNSGKSSLVHRFLTGTYMQEESPEGGRFKKEVIIDGQSYLLLIRDEGGPPEMQFTHWVDAVIFVFSLENEESFMNAHQYYLKMTHYRNLSDVPFILVGTQDYISESNPRVIEESKARNLANELKKCSYYETCATYGLHVERVFHDACQKVVNLRTQMLVAMANIANASSINSNNNNNCNNNSSNRPTTPLQNSNFILNTQQMPQLNTVSSSSIRLLAGSHIQSTNGASVPTISVAASTGLNNGHHSSSNSCSSSTSSAISASPPTTNTNGTTNATNNQQTNSTSTYNLAFFQANPHLINAAALHSTIFSQPVSNNNNNNIPGLLQNSLNHFHQNHPNLAFKEPISSQQNHFQQQQQQHQQQHQQQQQNLQYVPEKRSSNRLTIDPSSVNRDAFLQPDSGTNNHKLDTLITPCSTPNQKRKDNNRRRSNLFTPNKKEDKQNKLNDMGVGRSIPIKQGFLYKKTNSTINKDWKKKFVTLNEDGSLRYYPSMNDYMDDVHGKEIDLQKTTIKIPGSNKPRIGKSVMQVDTNRLNNDIHLLNINESSSKNGYYDEGIQPVSLTTPQPALTTNGTNSIDSNTNYLARVDANSKKRHRRIKSNHKSDQNKEDDQEGYEFIIVSLDNKQWHFEAASNEEREEWVQAVEQQILSSLQLNETNKLKTKHGAHTADNMTILTMKSVPGNSNCADCDAPNPVWASLNHGALICIECSGIHRNLGTHLSRVRSLELDDWSNELIQIMTSIGNRMINSIYEANVKSHNKPKPNMNSSREEKEKWIRAKYESKQFLASLPNKDITVGKQLLDAVSKQDVAGVILCLAYCKSDDVNTRVSQVDKRTSIHIAAKSSNIVILQLLIWYGADVEATDNHENNALAYATSQNCIQLLIHNGCTDNLINCNNNNTNLIQQQQQQQQIHNHAYHFNTNSCSNPTLNPSTNNIMITSSSSTTNPSTSSNTLSRKSQTSTSSSYIGLLSNNIMNNGLQTTSTQLSTNNQQTGQHYDKLPYNLV